MKNFFILGISMLLMQILTAQKLDRSQLPKAGPAPVLDFKDPEIFKLSNGITLLVVEDHRLPQVSASYHIDSGPLTEGGKAGMLSLLGGMLNEGTGTKTKLQFDEAVDQIGASVNITSSGGSATALTRYFDQALLLMADALRHPSFPQASFEKLKSQSLTSLKSGERNARAISGRVVNALVYGKEHPSGEFATGQTISSITLDDVKKAWSNYITPSNGYLTIVGDIKADAAHSLAVKAMGDWTGTLLTLPTLAKVSNPAKTEVDVVNVSSAVQSEITVTNLIDLPMNSPDYHALLLANQILGGGADSKLFRNLREKHGFTYGASSGIEAGRFQTTFAASAAVRNEKVDSAVVEFFYEINAMRTEKVSPEVLQSAKNLYNGAFALSLENPGLTASFGRNILINTLPGDFYRTYLQKINAVTADDILRVSQKYFGYNNSRVIIVGNSDGFLNGIGKLGFPVREYDIYGNLVQSLAQTGYQVKVKLENFKNYTPFLGYQKDGGFIVDTNYTMQDGLLVFKGKVDEPVLASFGVRNNPNTVIKITNGIIPGPPLSFFLTNEVISIAGDADKIYMARVEGGTFNAEYKPVRAQMDPLTDNEWTMAKAAYLKAAQGDSSGFENMSAAYAGNAEKIREIKMRFISGHPESLVSMYFLSTLINTLSFDELKEAYTKLGPIYKTSFYGREAGSKINNMEATSAGKTAIEINKTDLYGNPVSLASFKGKYVLLDFWGSWCGPCRASHPHLKALYSKYKASGFEIVGIAQEQRASLGDNRAAWKDAIIKDGMNWIQVLNNEGAEQYDAVKAYGVTAFPTKVLLDRDGKIMTRYIGDVRDLDDKLAKIFGF